MLCGLPARFGEEYVSQWNFESWNEPKLRHFDGLNMTIRGECFFLLDIAMTWQLLDRGRELASQPLSSADISKPAFNHTDQAV